LGIKSGKRKRLGEKTGDGRKKGLSTVEDEEIGGGAFC